MSKWYNAKYKCRNCNEEFIDGTTNNAMTMLADPKMLYLKHNCKDGCYGIADFIGLIPDKENENG